MVDEPTRGARGRRTTGRARHHHRASSNRRITPTSRPVATRPTSGTSRRTSNHASRARRGSRSARSGPRRAQGTTRTAARTRGGLPAAAGTALTRKQRGARSPRRDRHTVRRERPERSIGHDPAEGDQLHALARLPPPPLPEGAVAWCACPACPLPVYPGEGQFCDLCWPVDCGCTCMCQCQCDLAERAPRRRRLNDMAHRPHHIDQDLAEQAMRAFKDWLGIRRVACSNGGPRSRSCHTSTSTIPTRRTTRRQWAACTRRRGACTISP